MKTKANYLAGFDAVYLKSRLHYSPEKGIFIWIKHRKSTEIGKVAGTITDSAVRIHINGKGYKAHRLAWLYMTGEWPCDLIDHKNLNPKDNRWGNLRLANHSKNGMNTGVRSDNTSGYKGVAWDARAGKWRADIKLSGKRKHLGMFATPGVAHEAYKLAVDKFFGEFGRAS